MDAHRIPDDIVVGAFSVFREGDRKDDPAASLALNVFLNRVEGGKLSYAKARRDIADSKGIAAKIKKAEEIILHEEEVFRAHIAKVDRELTERIHANSEKTLSGQDEMRTEFKGLLGEMHSHVQELKQAAEASHILVAAIKSVTEKISTDVVRAVKNTSTKLAVTVALAMGIAGGLLSNAVYERKLSVEALKKSSSGDKSLGPSPTPGSVGQKDNAAEAPDFSTNNAASNPNYGIAHKPPNNAVTLTVDGAQFVCEPSGQVDPARHTNTRPKAQRSHSDIVRKRCVSSF